ncbi:hypothetical protein [Nocardia transvalensis]|uniref:hypothetical protein n=1 Tax=Nocardia transvalensis TaxID=37333 RepID=UPI001894F436|nr:hypothetical protein [Nocardia transvalensis]MBF6328473.1 hypothetical protein [Nocardia transvalensis]
MGVFGKWKVRLMQSAVVSATVVSAVLLWIGIVIQLVVRRGEPHREVLFATAAYALVATLFLPPVAVRVAELIGSDRPCNVFLNVWNVVTSGLMIFAVAAPRGVRSAASAAAVGIVVASGVWWMAVTFVPSPAGCVTSLDVPATSVYWWVLISWHLIAHATVLVAVFRDLSMVPSTARWERIGVWWYVVGFSASGAYWLTLVGVLVTERRYPVLTTVANGGWFPATVMTLTGAVWWIVGGRAMHYGRAVVEFWRAYRGLAARGWSQAERQELWAQSLRGWYLSPAKAAYRVRVAQADHAISRSGEK